MNRMVGIAARMTRRMIGVRGSSRGLMASIFLVGGLAAWKRAPQLAPKARRIADPINKATGLTLSGSELVRINAAVQLGAASLFALGFQQRLMALALAGSLVPTTIIGHAFWEADDEDERTAQKIHFLKNSAMLGGLVFAALDTGGRPSVFWTGKKAAEGIAESISATTHSVSDSVRDAVDR